MKRAVVLLLGCLPLGGQQATHRHAAGMDEQGNQLTVIERQFPKRAPNSKRCIPSEQYLLEQSRGGRVAGSEPVVTVCRMEDSAEISVEVKPNLIEVSENGGVLGGYMVVQSYQLSPWKAVQMEFCSFPGADEFTFTRWDLRKLRGQVWAGKSADAGGLCVDSPEVPTYLLAPILAYDARRLEASRVSLGSCASRLDASGRNGFITWGRPDPQDPLEVKLLWTGDRTLVAQVADPGRNTRPAASWVNADHFEIWMGARDEDAAEGSMWQFGIPVDEGPVQVGYGKPAKLPVVRRWTANLEDGRAGTVLAVELPDWPDRAAAGVTVVYSQSLEGRAQKRLIATSRVKRGDSMTLGAKGALLGKDFTCAPVKGALDVTGFTKKPLEVPEPDSGSSQ